MGKADDMKAWRLIFIEPDHEEQLQLKIALFTDDLARSINGVNQRPFPAHFPTV